MITNVPWAHSEENEKCVFLIKNKMLRRTTISIFPMKDDSHSLPLSPLIENAPTVAQGLLCLSWSESRAVCHRLESLFIAES